MQADITINSSAVDALLSKYSANLANMTPALNVVGGALKTKVLMGFYASVDPYGHSWMPVEREGKPLIDTGILKNSITYRVETHEAVEIGTNIEYAAKHQQGIGVYQREFLPSEREGLPDQWAQSIINNLINHILSNGNH